MTCPLAELDIGMPSYEGEVRTSTSRHPWHRVQVWHWVASPERATRTYEGQRSGERARKGETRRRAQQPYCCVLPSVAFLDDSQHLGR